mgnify:CR=1 FL=1|jgi:hypothetical protein
MSLATDSFRSSLEAIGLMEEEAAPFVDADAAEQPVVEAIRLTVQRSVSLVFAPKSFPRVTATNTFLRERQRLFGDKYKAWEFSLVEVAEGDFEIRFKKCPLGYCIIASPIGSGTEGKKVKARIGEDTYIFDIPEGVVAGGTFLGKVCEPPKKEPQPTVLSTRDIRAWETDAAKKSIRLYVVQDSQRINMEAQTDADYEAWCAALQKLPIPYGL